MANPTDLSTLATTEIHASAKPPRSEKKPLKRRQQVGQDAILAFCSNPSVALTVQTRWLNEMFMWW